MLMKFLTAFCSVLLLSGLLANTVFARAAHDIRSKVNILKMNNPAQQFELAAKLQWHAGGKKWDRILVVYNGHPEPPMNHPVWVYLSNMRVPERPGTKPGEGLYYKPFYMNAYCNGLTPLANNRPFAVNFENDTPGRYDQREFFRDWNCPGWNVGMANTAIVAGQGGAGGKQLQMNIRAGQSGCADRGNDGCINWKPHLGARLNRLTYSYKLFIPANFDFARGGQLPGISSVVPLATGMKPDGKNGWRVNTEWDAQGRLSQHVLHPGQRGGAGDSVAWSSQPLQKGRWYTLKTQVRLNAPGQANGAVLSWLDGKPVFNKQGLRFRYGNDLQIERLHFAVHYNRGGAARAPMQLLMDDFILQP